jgi:hypothetical protein
MGYTEELEAAYEEMSGKYVKMCLWVPAWCMRKSASPDREYHSFCNLFSEYGKVFPRDDGSFFAAIGQQAHSSNDFATLDEAKRYVENEFRIPNE